MCREGLTSLNDLAVSLGPVRLTHTRRFPSGDHWKLETPLSRAVTRRASPPASGSSQTCARGVSEAGSFAAGRADRNAMAFPSGLQRGLVDDCGEVVRRLASREPSADTIQMAFALRFCFWSTVVTTNAIAELSGEKCGSLTLSNAK